jgi:signal transduction histidine kinase
VRDHGAGIPAEYLHRVCDPFFTTKQQGDGNGLGLSVAQQIAAAHGGELRVETREGDGTRVVIALPKAPPDESAPHLHH